MPSGTIEIARLQRVLNRDVRREVEAAWDAQRRLARWAWADPPSLLRQRQRRSVTETTNASHSINVDEKNIVESSREQLLPVSIPNSFQPSVLEPTSTPSLPHVPSDPRESNQTPIHPVTEPNGVVLEEEQVAVNVQAVGTQGVIASHTDDNSTANYNDITVTDERVRTEVSSAALLDEEQVTVHEEATDNHGGITVGNDTATVNNETTRNEQCKNTDGDAPNDDTLAYEETITHNEAMSTEVASSVDQDTASDESVDRNGGTTDVDKAGVLETVTVQEVETAAENEAKSKRYCYR